MRLTATSALGLLILAGFSSAARATVYDFDAEPTINLDTSLWSMSQVPAGEPYFGKVVLSNSITLQKNAGAVSYTSGNFIATNFNMAAVGGSLSGNFSVSVDYTGASLIGNQFYLALASADGALSLTGHEGLLFSDNIPFSYITASASSFEVEYAPVEFDLVSNGTLTISRIDDSVSFFYNNELIMSVSGYSSPITGISLGLTSDGTNDYGTVTYSNFTINAVPEPASLGMLALAGAGLLMCRRK